MSMQALVEESARQQRVQVQQRELEERQKVQQAMFQVALASPFPLDPSYTGFVPSDVDCKTAASLLGFWKTYAQA